MKKTLFGIILIYLFQVSCAQQKQADKGNYFIPKESFFDRTLKPYNYQLTTDIAGRALGKITFWRTQPIFDQIQKSEWTPNITFSIYPLTDKAQCTDLSLVAKANSTCEIPNIGGDILIIGKYILLNTSTCVECADKAKVDYCRNILKHLFEYIIDTNSGDLNYLFGQLPIKRGTFSR